MLCPLSITKSYPQLTEIPSLLFAKTKRDGPSATEASEKEEEHAKVIRFLLLLQDTEWFF
jgi:hypothetical protein